MPTPWPYAHPYICASRILKMGTFTLEGLSKKIPVDQIMDALATSCGQLERLEICWDPETIRFSDKSQKAIDAVRVRCLRLRCLVLR